MSAVNTLTIEGATLHVSPPQRRNAGDPTYDLQVITADGTQARIRVSTEELQSFAAEALDMLTGDAMAFHAAGMRLQQRLNRISSK